MENYSITPAELPVFFLSYLVGHDLAETYDVYTIEDQDRAMLRQLVVYDTAHPTEQDTPTDEQMTSFLALPTPDGHPANFKNCRLFAQDLIPTIADSATLLQVWVNDSKSAEYGFLRAVQIKVRVLCHYAVETYRSPGGVVSRSLRLASIVMALLDERELPQLGIGTVRFAEMKHVSDNRERTGYELTFEVTV